MTLVLGGRITHPLRPSVRCRPILCIFSANFEFSSSFKLYGAGAWPSVELEAYSQLGARHFRRRSRVGDARQGKGSNGKIFSGQPSCKIRTFFRQISRKNWDILLIFHT